MGPPGLRRPLGHDQKSLKGLHAVQKEGSGHSEKGCWVRALEQLELAKLRVWVSDALVANRLFPVYAQSRKIHWKGGMRCWKRVPFLTEANRRAGLAVGTVGDVMLGTTER